MKLPELDADDLVRRFIWVCLAIVVILFLAGAAGGFLAARAQGHTEGHDRFHIQYQEWKQPGSGYSCCNVKEMYRNGEGTVIGHRGDCYPTEFRVNPLGREKGHGYWIAKLDEEDRVILGREWIEVPDSKIIREKNPDDSGVTGHLCINAYQSMSPVLCAVPPTGGL